MNIWIIQEGEPLPEIDGDIRPWRAAILANELRGRNHDVLWWASTFDHIKKVHRFSTPRTLELASGVKLRLLHGPGYSSNKSPKRFLHQRSLARIFRRECADRARPDLIVCNMPLPELAEQAVLFGRDEGIPVVIDVRDQWPDLYLTMFPAPLRPFARVALDVEFRRIKRAFQGADAILAVSDTYLKWALGYAMRPRRDADSVFPLGYTSTPFTVSDQEKDEFCRAHGIRRDALILTFVGMFGFSYDLHTVVKAAKILHKQNNLDVQIVLAGDGDAGPELRSLAGNTSNLVMTGWLDRSSVQKLLSVSSVGLVAYAADATQTLPNKPFEYMAAGLALLSSLQGELTDLINNNQAGLQYQAGQVSSLLEQIKWLAENPSECAAMGQRARTLFDEFFRTDIIYPRMAQHLETVVDASVSAHKSKVFAPRRAA